MNIGTKHRLATGATLAAIGLIAVSLEWTEVEVKDAERQRQQATEIAQGLTEQRLVMFEYLLNRPERARVQWHAVSDRLDRILAKSQFSEPVEQEILAGLRARKVLMRAAFAELSSRFAGDRAETPPRESTQRFESQLLSRLLIYQQNSHADALRLNDLATERINLVEGREVVVVLGGLALIALIAGGGAWLIHRGVLAPIVRLQRATQMVAAGDLEVRVGMARGDEIGELAKNFDDMIGSLRNSFAQIEQSNQALATAEERMRVTLNSAPAAMVMVDRAGTIVLVNAQTEMLFGYARSDLLGQAIEVLVPQRFRGGHRAQRDGFIARPQARRMGSGRDLYGLRKDGSEFPVEIGLNPIETAEGLFVLSAIVDITQRKQAMDESRHLNEALARHTTQLETANQELESFSYSVSHDLRGPLRSMDGFSLVLLEDYGDKLDEEGKDALGRIRVASQRMGGLIDDLLRLSQVTRAELKLKRVDLTGMARAVAESPHGERSGRTVEWAIEDGMTITADTELMRIFMQNLLQNAWKFTGKTERPTIRVGTLERDGKKVYFVADNGVGFDMAHADRLFGAFQRLHHAADFPGTGIGLAIAQRIIHRHDGKIWAEAKEGEGATFFFTIGDLGNDSSRQQDHPAG